MFYAFALFGSKIFIWQHLRRKFVSKVWLNSPLGQAQFIFLAKCTIKLPLLFKGWIAELSPCANASLDASCQDTVLMVPPSIIAAIVFKSCVTRARIQLPCCAVSLCLLLRPRSRSIPRRFVLILFREWFRPSASKTASRSHVEITTWSRIRINSMTDAWALWLLLSNI